MGNKRITENLTPQQIREECQELEWDIERYERELDQAQERLHHLKHEVCKHPELKRTGGMWPYTDDCPDCGMMFYLNPEGAEEFQ